MGQPASPETIVSPAASAKGAAEDLSQARAAHKLKFSSMTFGPRPTKTQVL